MDRVQLPQGRALTGFDRSARYAEDDRHFNYCINPFEQHGNISEFRTSSSGDMIRSVARVQRLDK